MKIMLQVFTKSLESLCLHVENNSDLLFKLAPEGWKIIWYFSFKHSMHFLVMGLNSLPFSIMLQEVLKFSFFSLSFHMWADKVVACSFSLFLKLAEWP